MLYNTLDTMFKILGQHPTLGKKIIFGKKGHQMIHAAYVSKPKTQNSLHVYSMHTWKFSLEYLTAGSSAGDP